MITTYIFVGFAVPLTILATGSLGILVSQAIPIALVLEHGGEVEQYRIKGLIKSMKYFGLSVGTILLLGGYLLLIEKICSMLVEDRHGKSEKLNKD